MAQIDEVAEGIYRISAFIPEAGITFNQFLIDDEKPALIHTGMFPTYEDVREAVAEVTDPSRLAYVVIPHSEADECGGMGRFVAEAPEAVLACGALRDEPFAFEGKLFGSTVPGYPAPTVEEQTVPQFSGDGEPERSGR